jgi:hypothetical protein
MEIGETRIEANPAGEHDQSTELIPITPEFRAPYSDLSDGLR